MKARQRLAAVMTAVLAGVAVATVPLSAPAYAAVVLSDDFEDGQSDGWSVVGTGNWAVAPDGTDNVYKATYSSGGTTTLLSSAGDAAWANYSVEATVKNYNDGNSFSLRGRYKDASNGYLLNIHTQNDTVSLVRTVGGTSTTLDTVAMALEPNVSYRLKLTLDGDQISGAVDGTTVVSGVDYALTTGRIAVGGYSKGSFSVDDVIVTETGGPPAGQGDRYVTPQGAGTKDGTSWANAMPGDQVGGLQSAWNATGATNTLHVGSGTYTVPQTLTMFTGGTSLTAMKTLRGIDRGSGLPVFRGDWSLTNQVTRSFVEVPIGVDFWSVRDVTVQNYHYGVLARGEHAGIRITNFDVTNMSDGVYLWGLRSGSDGANPDAGSHDIVISDGDYQNYTKSAVRFRNGNYRAAVVNCRADAGGAANWAAGNFPLGFRVGNSPQAANIFDHDILFQDVVSRNNYHNGGTGYWNGDGFTSERQSYNVTYVRARAFGNTDGGFDDKARNPVYIDSVALGNKRNFRVWSNEKATFIGVVAAHSVDRGGTGNSVGLWAGAGTAVADVHYSTITNNAGPEISLEDAVRVDVYDSIIAKTNGTTLYSVTGAGPLTVHNSEEYIAGTQGTDPQFVNGADRDWEGGSDHYNSRVYGKAKGYHHPGPYDTPYTIQPSATSVTVGAYASANVTASVRKADGTAVSDPQNVVWYSESPTVARVLVSRGNTGRVQGLSAGTTTLVAVYKGETYRITVTVTGTGAATTPVACHVGDAAPATAALPVSLPARRWRHDAVAR